MESIKVTATFKQLGGKQLATGEVIEIPYIITARDAEPTKKFRGKDGAKIVGKGVNTHAVKESSITNRVLNISDTAYNHYISLGGIIRGIKVPHWASMSQKERLEAHLAEMATDFKAISFTYEVLND